MSSNENLPPLVRRQLLRELRDVSQQPPPGIRVYITDDNLAHINADIDGPVSTPFEGGLFKLRLVFDCDFPSSPPKAYFLTKIFHPNVSPKTGEVCVNALKKEWKSDLGLAHLLLVIRCLLIHPNPDSSLNEEAGKLLQENYEDYNKRAALLTKIHAKIKVSCPDDSCNKKTNTTQQPITSVNSNSNAVSCSSPAVATSSNNSAPSVSKSESKSTTVVKKEDKSKAMKNKTLKRL